MPLRLLSISDGRQCAAQAGPKYDRTRRRRKSFGSLELVVTGASQPPQIYSILRRKKSAIVLVKKKKKHDLTAGKLVEHGTACKGSKPKDVVETAMESIPIRCFKH